MKVYGLFLVLICLSEVRPQIPVEFFVGEKKASADLMFFRFIKSSDTTNSEWLFFNRNRSVVDYEMTSSSKLPLFGHTMAFSYNSKALAGFAPVSVLQISNSGTAPKIGLQYAKSRKDLLLFTWLVHELKSEPYTDFFLLFRYSPPLNDYLNLFFQIESFNGLPITSDKKYNLVQRLRVGLKSGLVQFGAGTDLSQSGKNDFIATENFGLFIRYEY